MDRPIPGFYYDPEKKRYFKVVGSGHGSPASAAYNTDSVKKRKMDEQKADDARKRRAQTAHLIKRAHVLRSNPLTLTGGRLLRELGHVDPEMPVQGWASALRPKGSIDFGPYNRHYAPCAIASIYVDGDDTDSGLGVVYASTCRSFLAASYIPTDENDCINFNNDPQMRPSRLPGIHSQQTYFEALTSVHYHKRSNALIMVEGPRVIDSTRGEAASLHISSPRLNENVAVDVDQQRHTFLPPHPSNRPPGGDPRWLLGERARCVECTLDNGDIFNVRVAPDPHPSSVMLLATSHGLLEFFTATLAHSHPDFVDLGPSHKYQEVLSADYHPTNPNIVFAGRRDGTFFRVDRRSPDHMREGKHGEWETSGLGTGGPHTHHGPASVAHLRALDDHQILAAGPRSAMAVYDVRWMRTANSEAKHARATMPVVRMYEYANMPHIDIGLDVAMGIGGTGGGGGVVAAGQDDGTVGLFSVWTGQKLRAGAIDRIKVSGHPHLSIVKALQFARMPWERETSLFVGEGNEVKKYSVGTGEGEDEDEDGNEITEEKEEEPETAQPTDRGSGNRPKRHRRKRGRDTES